MVTVMRDTRVPRESTASGVMLLGTNADLRATFAHAFNGRRRQEIISPDNGLSFSSKGKSTLAE